MRLGGAITLATLLAVALIGCGGGGSPAPPPAPTVPPAGVVSPQEFDYTGMLTNLADQIIAPNYDALMEAARDFAAADGPVGALCEAVGTGGEAGARTVAQDAWRESMALIQATEIHVIGPALDNGEALRHRLLSYSAGPISTCGIDQSAALVAADDEFDIESRSANQRGFGAIEYLLFNDDLAHTCASQVPSTTGWNDLDETARRRARCELALAVAADAADAADAVAERWGGYRAEFLDEGNSGNSLQLVTDAIFAMDTLVKDLKLGIPAGIHDGCSDHACPERVESRFARNSLANVRANVAVFLDLFNGGEDGSGFDDLIDHEGHSDVSDRFQANADEVIEAIDDATDALYDELIAIDTNSEAAACMNAFAEPDSGESGDGLAGCRITGLLKRITDDLKIDFVTIVDVDIPGSAQTDND